MIINLHKRCIAYLYFKQIQQKVFPYTTLSLLNKMKEELFADENRERITAPSYTVLKTKLEDQGFKKIKQMIKSKGYHDMRSPRRRS